MLPRAGGPRRLSETRHKSGDKRRFRLPAIISSLRIGSTCVLHGARGGNLASLATRCKESSAAIQDLYMFQSTAQKGLFPLSPAGCKHAGPPRNAGLSVVRRRTSSMWNASPRSVLALRIIDVARGLLLTAVWFFGHLAVSELLNLAAKTLYIFPFLNRLVHDLFKKCPWFLD